MVIAHLPENIFRHHTQHPLDSCSMQKGQRVPYSDPISYVHITGTGMNT